MAWDLTDLFGLGGSSWGGLIACRRAAEGPGLRAYRIPWSPGAFTCAFCAVSTALTLPSSRSNLRFSARMSYARNKTPAAVIVPIAAVKNSIGVASTLGSSVTSILPVFFSACNSARAESSFRRAAPMPRSTLRRAGTLGYGRWWTRNERTRTVGARPLEDVLRDAVPAPAYQRLASAAADLRLKGWSHHSIALEFGVTGKTIARRSSGSGPECRLRPRCRLKPGPQQQADQDPDGSRVRTVELTPRHRR